MLESWIECKCWLIKDVGREEAGDLSCSSTVQETRHNVS